MAAASTQNQLSGLGRAMVQKGLLPEREAIALQEKANEAGALEAYLRQYPSGRFSELAQSQLDRILAALGEKKVEIVSSPQNPYSKGSARTDTAYRVGDRYSYRISDSLTQVEQGRSTLTVTNIVGDEVIFNKGGTVTDLLGNYRKWGGNGWAGSQTVPTEFSVGKRWSTRFQFIDRNGLETPVALDLLVAGRETIKVPAGAFNAFRVEARGWRTGWQVPINWNLKTWYAPDAVRRPVAWEWMNIVRGGWGSTSRGELIAFRQS